MTSLRGWHKRAAIISPDLTADFSVPAAKTTTSMGSEVFLPRNAIFLPDPIKHTDPDGKNSKDVMSGILSFSQDPENNAALLIAIGFGGIVKRAVFIYQVGGVV
jgi:hypothetical protein